MSHAFGRAAMLIALLVLTGACNDARAFIASPADFADYRAVRLAPSLDDQMAAAQYYLRQRPDGRYAARLRKFFARVEPLYYRVRSRNAAGLQAYLRALPDGPHAAEGLELLTELRAEARREALESRRARAAGLRLDAERKERRAAASVVAWWVRSLLDERLWTRPLHEAPAGLLVRFRLSLPAPRCVVDDPRDGWRRCSKTVKMDYPVAARRDRVRHTLSLEIELVLDPSWRVASATLSGPALFIRAEEARVGKLRDETDERLRRMANRRFTRWLTELLFDTEHACNGGSDAQGATTLRCEAVRLTVAPGHAPEDDVLWFERLGGASSGLIDTGRGDTTGP